MKVLLFFAFLYYAVFLWQSPGINHECSSSLHLQIHTDSEAKKITITSWKDANFEVYLVHNAGVKCINPYFPQIHINTDKPHNAWLQVVYTDSKEPRYKIFVDTVEKTELDPFYTFDKDFYDAPSWTYSFLDKPLAFWRGHAYAVKVDHEKKTIECLGGIEWGYDLKYNKLRPVALMPRPLNQSDWDKDLTFFSKNLPHYKFI